MIQRIVRILGSLGARKIIVVIFYIGNQNMAKLDIKVRRAMLNGCLDTRMASALRTHKKITAETDHLTRSW